MWMSIFTYKKFVLKSACCIAAKQNSNLTLVFLLSWCSYFFSINKSFSWKTSLEKSCYPFWIFAQVPDFHLLLLMKNLLLTLLELLYLQRVFPPHALMYWILFLKHFSHPELKSQSSFIYNSVWKSLCFFS